MAAVRTPTAPGDITPVPQGFSTVHAGHWRPHWAAANAYARPTSKGSSVAETECQCSLCVGVLLLLALEQTVLCRHSPHPCPLDHTPVYYMVDVYTCVCVSGGGGQVLFLRILASFFFFFILGTLYFNFFENSTQHIYLHHYHPFCSCSNRSYACPPPSSSSSNPRFLISIFTLTGRLQILPG